MERGFQTHTIRKTRELGGLWKLSVPGQSARQVCVPGCWENCPGLENYRGSAEYEKEFEGGGNLHFLFKGVSHTARVFLDGRQIAYHYNAFTPFEAVVPDASDGTHLLKIQVDNSFNEESALHIPNDYFTYGGINRPVILEEVGDAFLERLHFKPFRKDGIWHGAVKVRLRSFVPGMPVKVRLLLDGAEFALLEGTAESETVILQDTFPFPGVQAYEPDAPKLYSLTAILLQDGKAADDLTDRIGFREISIRGNRIFFNDSPLLIKGFNRHEDHGLFGCAIPYEAMDYDLRLFEDLGANAVRTCHYPNDERFLDLCDERGILVWEEGHARGLSEEQMRHKNFRRQSLDCLEEMIDNHYNHPCIFIWGILNECASFTEYGREVYREQFDFIRKRDDSRPLTFASCHFQSDICLDLPDIVSMNIYPLWYHNSPADEYLSQVYQWVQTTEGAGKPFLISEIGAGAIPGWHAPGNPKWSEERQAEILQKQLKAVLSHEETSGVFIWQFCDCRVPDDGFYGRPRCMNNKGIVDEYRRKKLAYHTIREIFTGGKQ
ncbi:MAG: hypothetical protein NC432_11175 [Roseburia sp.]|nr:hypothetical protein [Roseburia sp.]MCM1098986.1 hypothetical protein [Ruminococcus flavefaciens]